ncbi:MAG TPA: SRPBCC family protein [Polyangiaceae bacterium]|nr:SRPBCC family protein [Polyangiaceae bacterium]
MPVDVLTETVIERSAQEVAAFASEPDNAPLWYENIRTVEWRTPRPLAIGSRVAFVAHFLGRRLAYTYEIVQLVPGTKLVMQTAEGPFPMETSYEWHSEAETTTRMTLRNRGEPSGFSRLMSPFLAGAMRRANRNDLARLKALLEGTGRASRA